MRNTITLLLILLVLTAIGLTGCTGETGAVTLEGTPWVLESYGEQGNPQAVIEGSEITAAFDSAEDKVSGYAGCNNYFAGYEVKNNELAISAIGSTMMHCEGLMEQEQQYLAILEGAETFQVQDSQLRISSSGNQVLIFNAQ